MALENNKSLSEICQEIIRVLGKDSVNEIAKYLEEKDKLSTGALINDLSYDVKQFLSKFSIELSTQNYLEYVNRGRPPGFFPNVKKIAEWISAKNLDLNEWAVSQNIYKFGIRPTPVIDDFLKTNIIDNSVNKMEDLFAVKIEPLIFNLVNEMNKPK